ncbi:MAG: hypothetical protein NTW86_23495, partial [Candidatus Sumerlaeota bacterium]|nr:hypothetical protein [Candidatus Sumerlaeota bacterium]
MTHLRIALAFVLAAVGGIPCFAAAPSPSVKASLYGYDEARMIPASTLDSPEANDPSIAAGPDGLWMAWLEFVPGQGDTLHVGRRDGEGWALNEQPMAQPAKLADPTLTFDAKGRLWLTYETENPDGRQWDVFARQRLGDGQYGAPIRVSAGAGSDINHRVAADSKGGLWIAWQSDRKGQFDVIARYIDANGRLTDDEHALSASPYGDWRPAVGAAANGDVCVAWDSYDGDSYNILARWRIGGQWQPVFAVAATPSFEGRAQLAADRRGRMWALWEEGPVNWGKPFRGEFKTWNNVTDDRGPLHRFYRLRVARIEADGVVRPLAVPLPMPGLEDARGRENKREGVEELGAYYERGQLAVDSSDRLWVAYRHYDELQSGMAAPTAHHVEQGWRIYARCIDGESWSSPCSFDIHQRDGMQRLSIAPAGDGLALAWAFGRTDRRPRESSPRGVAFAAVSQSGGAPSDPALQPAAPAVAPPAARKPSLRLAAE